MTEVRSDWTKEEIADIYHSPLLELIYQAGTVLREFHNPQEVQLCQVVSIKTGGCSEDCAYCPQSSRYQTHVTPQKMMPLEKVLSLAQELKDSGGTRFCMGAAWRSIRDGKEFDKVCEMVEKVSEMGLEPCCTLGMLTSEQIERLKKAGLHSYNHNLDTGPQYYDKIITTRTYEDRLNTLKHVREAGVAVCCGGIMGLGESVEDRIEFLHVLATMPFHPESVPINALIPFKGTPLEGREKLSIWEMVRVVATARIVMPKAMVRLTGGRNEFSALEQAFCFMAGANSIHSGSSLLTSPVQQFNQDAEFLAMLGLEPKKLHHAESTNSKMA